MTRNDYSTRWATDRSRYLDAGDGVTKFVPERSCKPVLGGQVDFKE